MGMNCPTCAGLIEKAVKRLPGIEDASVAVLQNRAQVVYRPAFVEVKCTTLQTSKFIYEH
jgi:Cu+-exporting ATPase